MTISSLSSYSSAAHILNMFKLLFTSFLLCSTSHAFVPLTKRTTHTHTSSRLDLTIPAFADILSDYASSSLILSTIDADIANIPTNEFQTVFLGGLGVMAGGLISAIAVGAILEGTNGYAAVVAESYDLEADEEFWKGLSEEEARKAREMLQKVKQQRGDNTEQTNTETTPTIAATTTTTTTTTTAAKEESKPAAAATTTASATPATEDKAVDMFSDY